MMSAPVSLYVTPTAAMSPFEIFIGHHRRLMRNQKIFHTSYKTYFRRSLSRALSAVKRILRCGADDLLLNAMSLVLLSISVIAPLTFLFSRIYMLHHNYNVLLTEREYDSWLLQQCKHDEFYHNMKHHSSLCDDLAMRSRDSVLMTAIQRVIEKSYMCGFEPCSATLDAMLQWMTGRGLVATVGVLVLLLAIPSAVLPYLRRSFNNIADTRMRHLHHAPYGHERYIETALCRNITPWNDTRDPASW